jgi:asparagine synthase (glutamine-hydrolysing)
LGVPPELADGAARRMLRAMRHRGPDDSGIESIPDPNGQAPPAVLIHARLAILDLSRAGHQPMADAPTTPGTTPNWTVFNGEIFNFLELHNDLARAGWPCRTRCDTEVILHAYRAWGEACLGKFRGMFAWCLLDTGQGDAWFCRDRLGIKPLYLARSLAGGLLFASELRTLLAAGPELLPPRVNSAALESYFAQGAVCGLQSIVEGVELLAPGQSLWTDWTGRSVRTRTYWQVPFASADSGQAMGSPERAVSSIADTLRESVKLRLLADVPLGLFLSGGIDSGALATLATEVAGTHIQTVSIGFDQPDFDETEAAQTVARILGTEHRTLQLSGEEMLADLPDVLASVDQPTVDGFNTYFVARAARRAGLKVALSGVGGDELFGGYATFRDVPRAVRWRERLRWIGPAKQPLSRLLDWSGGRGGAKAAEMLTRAASPSQMYLLRRELFLPRDRRALHPLPPESDPFAGVPRVMLSELRHQSRGLDPFNQVSLFEMGSYLRHMLLRDADVFSMVHGLELRVPLLDHRLVEQTAALPGACKRADPRPKPLLLDAVGKRLPSLVFQQPKRGFTFPWASWLRGPLRARTAQALTNADVWKELGLHPSAPLRLWHRFENQDPRVSALQLLALVVLADFAVRHGLRRGR